MLDFRLKLGNEREIFLESIFQDSTYAGLLEGKVTATLNRRILDAQTGALSKIWPNDPKIVLGLEYYVSRLDEQLPPVRCAGRFCSYSPTSQSEKMASSLVAIWFQSASCPLMTEENMRWIEQISWNRFAWDFDF